jgi:hypothetical protein
MLQDTVTTIESMESKETIAKTKKKTNHSQPSVLSTAHKEKDMK